MRARAAAAVAVVAVLAGCTSGQADTPSADDSPSASSDLSTYLAQEADWKPCPASDAFLDAIPAGLQCATVRVPVDYASTAGSDDFTIALVKVPASGESAGSILINPGGPGASGFDSVAAGAEELQRNLPGYDLIGFDPRGVARSDGLDCGEPEAVRRDLIELDSTPEDAGELEALLQAQQEYEAACRAADPRWGFLGTASVARDVALLSQILGDEEIHYYGMSYGSEIGYELLRQFPDRIGRMILESPVDPQVEDQFVDQYVAFDATLAGLLAACASPQHQECGNGRTAEQVRADFLAAADRLEDPGAFETLTDDGRASESLVLFGMILPLYWEIDDEVTAWYLEAVSSLINEQDARPFEYWGYLYEYFDPEQERFTTADDIQTIVSCLDVGDRPQDIDVAADRADDERNLADLQARAPLLHAVGFAGALLDDRIYEACSYSAAAYADPAIPDPLPEAAAPANPGAAPVLVLGITGDTATPYAWAQRIAAELGVPLVTNDTTGHAVYPSSTNVCLQAVVGDYLRTGLLPGAPVTC
jgi:pimeloyl-ACP methyl ester carboxylesterase